jgi:hypothetical protein
MKMASVQQPLSMEALPSPLPSRPERSMYLRPTQGDENGFCSATALHGSVALPFVIPTGVFDGHMGPLKHMKIG